MYCSTQMGRIRRVKMYCEYFASDFSVQLIWNISEEKG